MFQRVRATVLGVCIVSTLLLVASGTMLASALSQHDEVIGKRAYTSTWHGLLFIVSPNTAYGLFESSIADLSFARRHDLEHRFARALFLHEGYGALQYCMMSKERNGAACHHEVLGLHVSELKDTALIAQIIEECHEGGTGSLLCEHSIGHAFAYAAERDADGVRWALSRCEELPSHRSCPGGVMMEYFLQTLAAQSEPVKTDDIFALCGDVPTEYNSSCSFWRTQAWWRLLMQDMPMSETTREIASRCVEAEMRGDDRQACFAGLGNSIGRRVPTIHDGVEVCRDSSYTDDDLTHCLSYMARRAINARLPETDRICDAAPEALRTECQRVATGGNSPAESPPFIDEL